MKNYAKTNERRERLIRQLTNELPVLRARLGASQEDIAEKIGVSRQTYNKIENGKKEMSWIVFNALIAVFQSNERTQDMIKVIGSFEKDLAEEMEI